MSSPDAPGHRSRPHTADIAVEAWAPTREQCVAEAVAGLVESFADISAATGSSRTVTVDLDAASDEDALVAVLDEVVYLLDTEGAVPLRVDLGPYESGLRATFHLAALADVEQVGAAPKAVSLHDLRFSRDEHGWSAHVLVDV